jgi:hypothetical protein
MVSGCGDQADTLIRGVGIVDPDLSACLSSDRDRDRRPGRDSEGDLWVRPMVAGACGAWSFPLRMNSGPMARSPGVGSRGIGGLGYPGNDSWAHDSVSGLPGLPIRPAACAPVAMCGDDDGVVRWAALDVPPPVQPARIAQARMARAGTTKRG